VEREEKRKRRSACGFQTPAYVAGSVAEETYKAMSRFYSRRYILRHLTRLDFQYAEIGLFGKKAVDKALKAASRYLESLEFPPKTKRADLSVNHLLFLVELRGKSHALRFTRGPTPLWRPASRDCDPRNLVESLPQTP
jgi:hypothetical protein